MKLTQSDKIRDAFAGMSDFRLAAMLAVAAAALLVLFHTRFFPYDIVDDAYIHFRIARNWMESGVPFFNLAQQVAVDSSPLWLLLLGLIIHLPIHIELSTFAVEVIAVAAASGGAFLFLRACGTGRGFAAVGSGLIFVVTYPAALNLMETPLAVVLGIAAAVLFSSGRAAWGALAALAVLTRLEFGVLLVLLGAAQLKEPRRFALPIIVAACLLAGGAVWYWETFGAILPATIEAKRRLYDVPSLIVAVMLLPGGSIMAKDLSALCFIAAIGIVVSRYRALGPLFRERGLNAALALALSGVGIGAAYVVNHVLLFPWYLGNVFPIAVLGIAGLAGALGQRGELPGRLPWPLILLGLPLLLPVIPDAYAAITDITAYAGLGDGARVPVYIAVAEALARENPAGTLLSTEIGGLGWGFPGRILDGAGLASPEARRYHPMKVPEERPSPIVGAIPPAYVAQVSPSFIVSLSVFAGALQRDEKVLAHYACNRLPPVPPALLRLGVGAGDSSYMLVCRRTTR